MARRPLAASSTAKPSSRRVSAVIWRSRSLSSTTRTEAFCVMILMHFAQRQSENYAGAGRRFVGNDGDRSAVFFDDRLGKKQAEADAFAFGGEERLEQTVGDLAIDADAGVSKRDGQITVVAREVDRQPAAVGHRLRRVHDHVDETCAKFFRVDVEGQVAFGAALDDLDALALQAWFAKRQHALHQLADIGRGRMD